MNALLSKIDDIELSDSIHDEDIEVEDIEETEEKELTSSGTESESDEEELEEESDEETDDKTHEDSIKSDGADKADKADEADETTATSGATKTTNKRKRRQPQKWIKEVKHYQSTTNLLIGKKPFSRLVKEITQDYARDMRWSVEGMFAIQTGAEDFLTDIFKHSQLLAIFAGRDTIMTKDMQFVIKMLKELKWDI